MKRGGLITFSGIDGAGKSTQIDLLIQHLAALNHKPVRLWTRGGYTSFLEWIKRFLRRLLGRAVPPPGRGDRRDQALRRSWVRSMWLTASMLDLIRVYGLVIRWWQWRGRTVICDRYLLDTAIDFRLNFPEESVEKWWLWRFLVRVTPKPNVTFVLLIPVEESVLRSEAKGEPFRDSPRILAERLRMYKETATREDWCVLDATHSIETVFTRIKDQIERGAQERNAL